jgi:hypothetical protein
MGKKPVLGMVSALCVGLALTGCRNAEPRSDGSLLTKSSGPIYKPSAAFSTNGTPMNTNSANAGWNNAPTTASRNSAWMGGSPTYPAAHSGVAADGGMNHSDMMNSGRMTPNIQTTGMTAPSMSSPGQFSQDVDPAAPRMNVPAPPTEAHFSSPGEMHTVPGVSARVLAPPPSFTNGPANIPANLPDVQQAPAPPTVDSPALDGPKLTPPAPPTSVEPPPDPTPSSGAVPTPPSPSDFSGPQLPPPPLPGPSN